MLSSKNFLKITPAVDRIEFVAHFHARSVPVILPVRVVINSTDNPSLFSLMFHVKDSLCSAQLALSNVTSKFMQILIVHLSYTLECMGIKIVGHWSLEWKQWNLFFRIYHKDFHNVIYVRKEWVCFKRIRFMTMFHVDISREEEHAEGSQIFLSNLRCFFFLIRINYIFFNLIKIKRTNCLISFEWHE